MIDENRMTSEFCSILMSEVEKKAKLEHSDPSNTDGILCASFSISNDMCVDGEALANKTLDMLAKMTGWKFTESRCQRGAILDIKMYIPKSQIGT